MRLEEFETIVDKAVSELPKEFFQKLDNVAITVEQWPTPADLNSIGAGSQSLLFGIYRGVPKTKRGIYYSTLPDKITIFAIPILMVSKTVKDAKERIKETVLHEIAHHFGMTDEELRRIKY